jgi:hypothetical protein
MSRAAIMRSTLAFKAIMTLQPSPFTALVRGFDEQCLLQADVRQVGLGNVTLSLGLVLRAKCRFVLGAQAVGSSSGWGKCRPMPSVATSLALVAAVFPENLSC